MGENGSALINYFLPESEHISSHREMTKSCPTEQSNRKATIILMMTARLDEFCSRCHKIYVAAGPKVAA